MARYVSHIAKARQSSLRVAYCGVVLIFFSVFIMVGWLLGIPFMVQFLPGMKAVVFNSALCFFFLGILFLSYSFAYKDWPLLRLGVCSFLMLVGSLSLIENVGNYDFGIERLIVQHWLTDPLADPYLPPGRMTLLTSLGFIFNGLIGLLLPYGHKKPFAILMQFCVFFIFLSALFGLFTYSLNVNYLIHEYIFMQHLRMPAYSAICLIAASIGWSTILKESPWHVALYRGKEYQLMMSRVFAILLSSLVVIAFSALYFLVPLIKEGRFVPLFLTLFASLLLFACLSFILLYLQVGPLVRKIIISTEEAVKSRQRLQQTEERYLTAIKGSTAAWTWNIQNNTAFFSPHFKYLLGYGVDELPSAFDSFEKNLHPLDHAKVMSLIKNHLEKHAPFKTDFRLKTKSGVYRWFDGIGQASWDAHGQPLSLESSITDITEHKKIQQSLAIQFGVTQMLSDSHHLQEASAKLLPLICKALDFVFGALWVRETGKDVLSCLATWHAPEEDLHEFEKVTRTLHFARNISLPGRIWKTRKLLVVPNVGEDVNFQRRESAKRAKLHTAFGFPIIVEGHTLGVFEFFTYEHLLIDEHLLAIVADIGPQIGQFIKRKQAEQELRESEALKSAILESVQDSILRLDRQGAILSCNLRTSEMFAYSLEELRYKNIDELVPNLAKKLANYKFNAEIQFIGLKKNKEDFPVEVNLSTMVSGDQLMFVCIIRDITERKKMEKMKNEFISTVSHELRTPLTSIKGAIGLLLGKWSHHLNDKAKRLLDIADKNCERLIRLINEILDFEKIKAGEVNFNFEKLNLKHLIQEAIKINAPFAEKFNVYFKLEKLVDAPVVGDSDKLMQVMTNLLSNAAKFSPAKAHISINLVPFGDNFRVLVRDYGIGIPVELQPKIFQRFIQADKAEIRGVSGTGLGLSICKAIIGKHSGRLGFISEEGLGSTFYFDLPSAEVYSTGRSIKDLFTPKSHILVCESDEKEGLILRTFLEEHGFSVDIVKSSHEVRQFLTMYKYGALILDMTTLGSALLIKELQAHEELSFLFMIIIAPSAKDIELDLKKTALDVINGYKSSHDQAKLLAILNKIKEPLSKRPRILSIEDHSGVPAIWKNLFKNYADISVASSASLAKELLEREKFDLILLDLKLEDDLGTELLPYIDWKTRGVVPIIVFSASGLDEAFAKYVYASLIESQTSHEQLVSIIKSAIEKKSKAGKEDKDGQIS